MCANDSFVGANAQMHTLEPLLRIASRLIGEGEHRRRRDRHRSGSRDGHRSRSHGRRRDRRSRNEHPTDPRRVRWQLSSLLSASELSRAVCHRPRDNASSIISNDEDVAVTAQDGTGARVPCLICI